MLVPSFRHDLQRSCGVVAGRFPLSTRSMGHGKRAHVALGGMPGSAYENVGEWGVPGLRADRTQRGHGRRRAEPFGGEPAWSVGKTGCGSRSGRRRRRLPDARRRRWCGPQRRRQWCARSPLGGPTPDAPRNLARSASDCQRRRGAVAVILSDRWRGVGPGDWGTGIPPLLRPGRGDHVLTEQEAWWRETRATNRNPAVGNGSRTSMTRPAWGLCAADRLMAWSERSMHPDRAMERRCAGALRLKASSGEEGFALQPPDPDRGRRNHRLRHPVRAACEGVHTPRRQQFPRGRPSGDSVDPPGHARAQGSRPRVSEVGNPGESRTSRPLCRRRSGKKAT